LWAAARQAPDDARPAWALVVHDQSELKYPRHARKADQAALSSAADRGYELTCASLVDGGTGEPLAPGELRLRAEGAAYSTRAAAAAGAAEWPAAEAGGGVHGAGAAGGPVGAAGRPGGAGALQPRRTARDERT